MATRSPLPSSTWRSRQLYAALMVPPTNHFANGGSSQSRTRSHFWSQSSRSACSAQNASRSAAACSYASSWRLAFAARSAGGSNRRSSRDRFDRVSSLKGLLLGVTTYQDNIYRTGLPGGCPPTTPRQRFGVLVRDRLLGSGTRERPDLELGVALRGLRLVARDRPEP